MFTVLAVYALAGVVSVGIGKVAGDKFYSFEHHRHQQQRAWANLSKEMAKNGFKRIPEWLDELAFDDIFEFLASGEAFAEDVLKHPTVLEQEFADLFARQLDIKLADPAQVALIQSKIAALAGATSTTGGTSASKVAA